MDLRQVQRARCLLSVGTYIVIVTILDGSHAQDEDQRQGGGDWAQRGNGRDELKHEQDQEVEVGSPHELLQQVDGQEGQQCVLGGVDAVVLPCSKSAATGSTPHDGDGG